MYTLAHQVRKNCVHCASYTACDNNFDTLPIWKCCYSVGIFVPSAAPVAYAETCMYWEKKTLDKQVGQLLCKNMHILKYSLENKFDI